jgi:tetratricopeptide (TPR) repeat protein
VGTTLTRSLLVAGALLAAAWLALGYRAVELGTEGAVAGAPGPKQSPAQVAKALDDLKRARFLNADPRPLVDEALVYAKAGNHPKAVEVAERVVVKEPENYAGWLSLYAFTSDPARKEEAYRHMHALDPQLAEVVRPSKPPGS